MKKRTIALLLSLTLLAGMLAGCAKKDSSLPDDTAQSPSAPASGTEGATTEPTVDEEPETEETEAKIDFSQFDQTFTIQHYRGITKLTISADGTYQLHTTYESETYDETGKLGDLHQTADGNFEAAVLSVETAQADQMSYLRDRRPTFFAEGSTVHFYLPGTGADVLGVSVWINTDHTSVREEEYAYNKSHYDWFDAAGNFAKTVIWMEGSESAFIG